MNKYSVGDMVLIRDNLTEDGEYDTVGITMSMASRHGTLATILDASQKYNGLSIYRIREDGGVWVWSDSMFAEPTDYFGVDL
jgi:hypothetical protein